MKNLVRMIGCATLWLTLCCVDADAAAPMNNFCVTPPFIQQSILPNLLLIIDNSASMYDLAHTDTGRKVCSTTTTTYCTTDAGCPSGETCSVFTRQPYYCYDQTFTTAKTYAGYFDSTKLYKYDSATSEFVEDTGAFSCTAGAGEEAKSFTGQLCIVYTTTTPSALVASKFRASGQYLNWLTASKFDVQKKILTGGKYDGTDLLAESRGCVGQSFIKEASNASFVPYNSPETNNTNTPLGVTFGIRGPYDSVNPSAPSPGGQTYLDIFKGAFTRKQACQEAIDTIADSNSTLAEIKQNTCLCLTGNAQCQDTTGTQTAQTKTKVTFQQSMQACWACKVSTTAPYTCTKTDIGIDELTTVKNQCVDVYNNFGTCQSNPQTVCATASKITGTSADCGGGTCLYGPDAIVSGNAALVCDNSYEGQYYFFQPATTAGKCTATGTACPNGDSDCPSVKKCSKSPYNICTSNNDCPGSGNPCKAVTNTCATTAVPAAWLLRPDATEDAMKQTHRDFCGAVQVPQVIDPTDAPSDTSKYDNLPAILSGTGVQAELNQPVGTLTVKLKQALPPTGIVSDFSSQVRIGAMTFNFAGSPTESAAGLLLAPRVCSNDSTKICTINLDCVQPGGVCTATTSTSTPPNLDGAKIIHYVGAGHCSITTGTVCYNDTYCPAGEVCKSDGVGNYSSGLVKAINDIRANSWTPFAEAFYNAIGYFAKTSAGTSRTDLRLNTSDFIENRNPSQYKCQSNNILLVSDGMSTADRNSSVDNLAKLYTAAGGATSWTTGTPSYPLYAGSVNLDNMAWIAHNRNISTLSTSSASTATPVELNESITSYVVFNGDSNGQAGELDSKTLLNQTAVNGGTTLYQAVDSAAVDTALRDAFKAIAGGAASGTAASILSNSEGSGATLMQALFYPKKEFDKLNATDTSLTAVTWIGELQSYWYYLDPYLQNTSIREDTNKDNKLSLLSDKVIQFYFDPVKKQTLVNKYSDLNGDGSADSGTPDSGAAGVSPDVVNSLWKAGRKLWERNLASDPRKIYVGLPDWVDYSATNMMRFDKTKISSVRWVKTFLEYLTQTIDVDTFYKAAWGATSATYDTKFDKLVDYVSGIDQANDADGTVYRSRKVQINGCGLTDVQGCYREWKLGDIVSSTPKIVSNLRLNNYDLPSPTGYNDKSYAAFTKTSGYASRGMAFVGGNDGMLHAFKLGVLKELKGKYDKAQLNDSSGNLADAADQLGREQWAFIPKGALPYLRYLNDPLYGHQYYVDRSPTVFDASIGVPTGCAGDYSTCIKSEDGSTWRTVLIGGMGLGGGTNYSNSLYDSATNTYSCAANTWCTNCVNNPICDYSYYGGMSEYYALDVTNPETPKMLWSFMPWSMGLSTTGPAIVRIAHKDASGNADNTKNGKWFAVFASGATGPIDTVTHQFKGESQQELKLYIVDIASGSLVRTIYTGIFNAFAGTLSTSWIDTDRSNVSSSGYYSDDAVYIGYVQKDTSVDPPTWTKGGVLRLLTRESNDPNSSDVNKKWTLSTLINNVGPVTTSISKLQDRRNNTFWIYFGTGRFFYKGDDTSTTRQAIYGIKEPCYSTANRTMQAIVPGGTLNDLDQNCTDAVSGTFVDQSDNPTATISGAAPGWKVLLDAKDDTNGYLTERVITDPIAATSGAVFFTSFKPSSDLCKYGGNSLLWALRYDTGGTPPAASMQGKALMQVSTGAFAEIKLSEAFRNPGSTRYDGRRLANPITGVPPTAQGLSLFANPPPTKQLLHIREK